MKDEIYPRLSPLGDSALLIEFGDSLDPVITDRVYALDAWLARKPFKGIKTWVPAYSSLVVHYNPLETNLEAVQSWLTVCLGHCSHSKVPRGRKIEISVRYGGENGPDLDWVADFHGIEPAEIVRRHAGNIYRVAMMGFTPGFGYLLGMDPKLATPRLATPRSSVSAGSVGIAGGQTGIYPLDSPGGWRLIGKTDQVLFDPDQEKPFLLAPGDEVRFIPIEGPGV